MSAKKKHRPEVRRQGCLSKLAVSKAISKSIPRSLRRFHDNGDLTLSNPNIPRAKLFEIRRWMHICTGNLSDISPPPRHFRFPLCWTLAPSAAAGKSDPQSATTPPRQRHQSQSATLRSTCASPTRCQTPLSPLLGGEHVQCLVARFKGCWGCSWRMPTLDRGLDAKARSRDSIDH